MSHQETPHPEPQIDEWHQHTAAEGAPQQEHAAHVNIGALIVTFVVMAAVVLALVVALTVFYKSTSAQLASVRLENTVGWTDDYTPYRDASIERISGYHAHDAEAGTVQIPVDRAIDAVIENYGGGR